MILDLGRDGLGSGKAVVFTESITTQEYLRSLLLAVGLRDEDITLFRGNNDHERLSMRWLTGRKKKASGLHREQSQAAKWPCALLLCMSSGRAQRFWYARRRARKD